MYASGKVKQVSSMDVTYETKEKVSGRFVELETNEKIEKGVSGGAVINGAGEVIGVLAAVRTDGGKGALCVDVSEVRPFLGAAYRNWGTQALRKGEHAKAVARCTKSMQFNPSDPLTYNERGAALSFLERYDDAIADYTAAIKLDPKLPRAPQPRLGVLLPGQVRGRPVADPPRRPP